MKNKNLIFLLLLLIIFGCFSEKKEEIYLNIISPKIDENYISEDSVVLEAEGNTDAVIWEIDDLILAYGLKTNCELKEGQHTIKVKGNGEFKDQIIINVLAKKIKTGEVVKKVLFQGDNIIKLNNGKYRAGIIREDRTSDLLEISFENEIDKIENNAVQKALKLKVLDSKKISEQVNKNPEKIVFELVNLEDQYSDTAIMINANRQYEGENCNIYIDEEDEFDYEKINSIGEKADKVLIPRDKKLFGLTTDVDMNGKVNILMTGYLNRVEIAYGFFVATDLFVKSSENVISNYQEILYTGIPDDGIFNQKTLEATIAHEYQHLINFSNKSYKYILREEDPPYENIALNEGLSHFAEDLNGYNLSGGNVKCVDKYLKNSSEISLFYGSDSIARRGAFYLLLRYLIDSNGGIEYSGIGEIIGGDGLEYLQNMIKSKETGIENLEKTFGKRIEKILEEWTEYMLKSEYKYSGQDFYTKENYGVQINEEELLNINFSQSEKGILLRGLGIGYKEFEINSEFEEFNIKIEEGSKYKIVLYKIN